MSTSYYIRHHLQVANREERGQRLKRFAIGQFHNDYQYKSDKDNLTKIRLAAVNIKTIQVNKLIHYSFPWLTNFNPLPGVI